jgi:mannose-6-phosphate isomerase-like protein (cupin superfamily)
MNQMQPTFKPLSPTYDYLAPDTSEIRLLTSINQGGLCLCTLPINKTSSPVKHKTVNEIWYCISGNGEIWLSAEDYNKVVAFHQGDSFLIPVDYSFQFRNTGDEPLNILITTMPSWPGPEEAVTVPGKWSIETKSNQLT